MVTAVDGASIFGKSINGCVFFIGTGIELGIAAATARIGEGESIGPGGFAGGRVGK